MGRAIKESLTVLVVDDEALIRMFATDILEDEGFSVIEARNGPEALSQLNRYPGITVLLTDINMPGMPDGLDLAHEAHRRWPGIQIIITSGRVQPMPHSLPPGSSFVPKPYTGQEIISLLAKR